MTEQICPYCRTAISDQDEVNICPACDTPHHFDCWEENRGCTVFGCSMAPPDEEKIDVEVETRREEDTRETPQAPMPEEQKVAPGAILSIVLGVVGFFYVWGLLFGGLAIFKAIQARKLIKSKPNEYKGLGLSNVGIVIGAITFSIWAMLLLAGAFDFGEALIVNLVLLFPVVLIFFSKSKNFFLQKENRLRVLLSCLLIKYSLKRGEVSRLVNELRVLSRRNARQELKEMLDAFFHKLKAAMEDLNRAFSLYGTDAEVKNYILSVISELEQINNNLDSSEEFQSDLSGFLDRIRLDERLEVIFKESKLVRDWTEAAIALLNNKKYFELSILFGEIKRLKSSKILVKEFLNKLESLCQKQIRFAEALTIKGDKEFDGKNSHIAIGFFKNAITQVADYDRALVGLNAATERLKQSNKYLAAAKQAYNQGNYWGYRSALKYARLVVEFDKPLGLAAEKIISAASEQLSIRNKAIRRKAFISGSFFCFLCLLSAVAYVKYEEWRIKTGFDKIMNEIEISSDFQESSENLQQFISAELRDPYASIQEQDDYIPIAIRISKIIYAANEQQLKMLKEEAENRIRWLEYKIDQNEFEHIFALVEKAESLEEKIAILENGVKKIDTDEFRDSLKEGLDFFIAEKYAAEFQAFKDSIKLIILDNDLETARSKVYDFVENSDDDHRTVFLRLEIRKINEAIDERDYQKAKQASMDFPDEKMRLCMQYMKEHPTGKYRDEIKSIIAETQNEIDRRDYQRVSQASMDNPEEKMKLCIKYLFDHPNGKYRDEVREIIIETRDAIDAMAFKRVSQVPMNKPVEKINLCEKYLQDFPSGNYREDIRKMIRETQASYFREFLKGKERYVGAKAWEKGIAYSREVLKVLNGTSHAVAVNEFIYHCRECIVLRNDYKTIKKKVSSKQYESISIRMNNRQKKILNNRLQNEIEKIRDYITKCAVISAEQENETLQTLHHVYMKLNWSDIMDYCQDDRISSCNKMAVIEDFLKYYEPRNKDSVVYELLNEYRQKCNRE